MIKIDSPVLLLNEEICKNNLTKTFNKASENNLSFRPHFKTHQSVKIGNWFRELGIDKITVSSAQMAEYFANAGWKDITVAFPLNILEIERIKRLSENLDNFNLIILDDSPIELLDIKLNYNINVFIKIDTGANRSGIKADNIERIAQTIKNINSCKKLKFKGFLTHAGQSYNCRSIKEIEEVHIISTEMMRYLKEYFKAEYPDLIISVGDTPTFSVSGNWNNIDEIRPGNFVFYDLMQWQIGSCKLEEIAVSMICPVVGKNFDKKEIVIYGGAVHFSKEYINLNGNKCFGLVSKFNPEKSKIPSNENYIKSLSQEHGIIKADDNFFDEINIGDLISVLPVHSCLTADCMKKYFDNYGNEYDHFGSIFR